MEGETERIWCLYGADISIILDTDSAILSIPHVAEVTVTGSSVMVQRHEYFMTVGPKGTGTVKDIAQETQHTNLKSAIETLWAQDAANPESAFFPVRFSEKLMNGF